MKSFLDIFKKKKEKSNIERSFFEDQETTVNMYSHFNIEKDFDKKYISLNDFISISSYIIINKKLLKDMTNFFKRLTKNSNNPEFNNKILNLIAFLMHKGEYNLYNNVFKARYRSNSNFSIDLSIEENYDGFVITKDYVFKDDNEKEQEIIQMNYNNKQTSFVITKKESIKYINCEKKPFCLETKYNINRFCIKDGIELSKEIMKRRDKFKIDSNNNLCKDKETPFSNYLEKEIYHRIPDEKYLIKEYKKGYDFPNKQSKMDIDSVLLIYNGSKEKLKDGSGSCFPKILFEDTLNGNITPDEIWRIINIRNYDKQIEEAMKIFNKIKEEEIARTFNKQEEQTK